jgi:hypothetical protein
MLSERVKSDTYRYEKIKERASSSACLLDFGIAVSESFIAKITTNVIAVRIVEPEKAPVVKRQRKNETLQAE